MATIESRTGLFEAMELLNLIKEKLKEEDEAEKITVSTFKNAALKTEGFHLTSTFNDETDFRKLNIAGVFENERSQYQLIIADDHGYSEYTKDPVAGSETHGFYDINDATIQAVNWLMGRKRITWPEETLR